MRSKVLLTGAILLVAGILLLYGGSSLIEVLALSTATVSVRTEAQAPMLITVEQNSFKNFSTPVSTDNLRSLIASYDATGDMNFYIMDQVEFESWRNGQPTTVQFSLFLARNGSLTFTPSHEGMYHFIFDNEASHSVSVMFNLSLEKVSIEANSSVKYLPYGLIICGVILAWPGLRGKRRPKPLTKERATLERIAKNFSIEPKGLTDEKLRDEIRKKVTQED